MVDLVAQSRQLCRLGSDQFVTIQGRILEIGLEDLILARDMDLTSHVWWIESTWFEQYMDWHRSQPPISIAAASGHPATAQAQ